MKRWRDHPLGLLAALALTLAATPVQPAELSEYAVKAAILYKLSKFVDWPERAFAGAGAPFGICVLGDNPFGDALDALSGQKLGDRPVAIRYLPGRSTAAEGCQLLFVSASEHYRLRGVLRAVGRPLLLTVGDREGFAEGGGMINLITVGKNIRFEINRAAVERAGLKIQAQLLRLATIVNADR